MDKVKMKYFKKACVHDKFIVALNALKDKYLNYETSTNGDLIGKVCLRCHDSKTFNSLECPRISTIKMVDMQE